MLQERQELDLAEGEDEDQAMAALGRFASLCQVDMLPEFYRVVDTLLHRAPEIFNFHPASRSSSGPMEGQTTSSGS
jgi:hypothetical protein